MDAREANSISKLQACNPLTFERITHSWSFSLVGLQQITKRVESEGKAKREKRPAKYVNIMAISLDYEYDQLRSE